jgi:hypothetical protein
MAAKRISLMCVMFAPAEKFFNGPISGDLIPEITVKLSIMTGEQF